MEYSEQLLSAIARAHPAVLCEIEARDTVFRAGFDAEQRRKLLPYARLGRPEFQQEDFDLWVRLAKGELSESAAIEGITDLMEQYYGRPYPLR